MTARFDRDVFVRPIAHRGMHDDRKGIVENTAAAFTAAIDRSFGIECDLRASSDGEPVVFHDATLDRLTDGVGALAAMDVAQIKQVRHRHSGEQILTFAEFLALVGGRVPVLAEVKSDWTPPEPGVIRRLSAIASAYTGPLAFMSFDPAVLVALREAEPDVPRGIVSSLSEAPRWNSPAIDEARASALGNLLECGPVEPHFVAYDVDSLPTPVTRYVREVQGLPIFAWTVRSDTQRERAALHADAVIFEHDGAGRII